jgi:hypothetical protein
MKIITPRIVEKAQAAGKCAADDLRDVKHLRQVILPVREEELSKIKARLNDVRSKHAPMAAAVERHGGKIRRDGTGHAITEDLEQLAEMLEEQAQNMRSVYFSFELENVASQVASLAKCYREFAVVARTLLDLELQHSRPDWSSIKGHQGRDRSRPSGASTTVVPPLDAAPAAGGGFPGVGPQGRRSSLVANTHHRRHNVVPPVGGCGFNGRRNVMKPSVTVADMQRYDKLLAAIALIDAKLDEFEEGDCSFPSIYLGLDCKELLIEQIPGDPSSKVPMKDDGDPQTKAAIADFAKFREIIKLAQLREAAQTELAELTAKLRPFAESQSPLLALFATSQSQLKAPSQPAYLEQWRQLQVN